MKLTRLRKFALTNDTDLYTMNHDDTVLYLFRIILARQLIVDPTFTVNEENCHET
jgi:hypothetical protein